MPKVEGPQIHHLKTWPEFFEASLAGIKPFEVRKNTRDFKLGDILILEEYLTGRKLARTITYIFDNPGFCADGYVVLGVK